MIQKITDCGQTAHDDYIVAGVTDDLIARLRDAEPKITRLARAVGVSVENTGLCTEAADRIEQLQREIERADYATRRAVERAERAEEERDERPTKRLWDETATALETLRVKFHNVNAECERNRKLLREWRSLFPGMSVEPGSLRDRTDSAMQEGK